MINIMDRVKYVGTYFDLEEDATGLILSITDEFYNVGFTPDQVYPCYEYELKSEPSR